MARKYLAGNRIVGTSEERMVTIDNGKKFDLDYETHIASDSYCTDFSTTVIPVANATVPSDGGANTASDNSDWTSNAGTTEISSNRLNCTLDSGRDTVYYDLQNSNGLGSGNNANDTEWCIRFSVEWVSKSTNSYFAFGISDTTGVSNTSQDFMGMKWKYESSKSWGCCDTSAASVESAGIDDAETSDVVDPSTGTKYYFEIVRFRGGSSAGTTDTYRVCRFPDNTYAPTAGRNGATTRSIGDSATGTSINDLRYLKMMCWGDSTSVVRIDDVRFFNKRDALGVLCSGGLVKSSTYLDNQDNEFQEHTNYPTITSTKMKHNMDACSSSPNRQRGWFMLKNVPDLSEVDFTWKVAFYQHGRSYDLYRMEIQMPRDAHPESGQGRKIFAIGGGANVYNASHRNQLGWIQGWGDPEDRFANCNVFLPENHGNTTQVPDQNRDRIMIILITKEGTLWTMKNVTPPSYGFDNNSLYHSGSGTSESQTRGYTREDETSTSGGGFSNTRPDEYSCTIDMSGTDGNDAQELQHGGGSGGTELSTQAVTRIWYNLLSYNFNDAGGEWGGAYSQDNGTFYETLSMVTKQKAFTPTTRNTMYEETDTGLTFIWNGSQWKEFDKKDYSSGLQ